MTPRAGQIYRAKAARGYRYIRVSSVHASATRMHAAHVVAREILPSGQLARGRDAAGVPRDEAIAIYLTWERGVPIMPSRYELAELPGARKAA